MWKLAAKILNLKTLAVVPWVLGLCTAAYFYVAQIYIPKITSEAVNNALKDYVHQAELTAAVAQRNEITRQLNVSSKAISDVNRRFLELSREYARQDKEIEQKIKDYENALNNKNAGCALSGDDIRWLLK